MVTFLHYPVRGQQVVTAIAKQGAFACLRVWCVVSCSLVAGTAAAADQRAGGYVEAGASWLYFNYQETGSAGQVLNEETGDIPGVYVAWSSVFGSYAWARLEASYASHSVTYEGQTQAGAPLTTSTHERLIHYDGRVGGQWLQTAIAVRPFLSVRYQRWDREIQPTASSLALNEYYRWWEAGVGVESCGSGWSWAAEVCLDLGVFRTTAAEVEVALGSDPDNYPVLEPGDGSGYRVQLRWSPPASSHLVVSLFHAAWDFDRSDSELVRLGFAQLRIREPASEASRQGVRVALRF